MIYWHQCTYKSVLFGSQGAGRLNSSGRLARRAIKQKAEAALIPDPFVTLICSVKTNHYIIQAGDLKSTLVFSHTTLWIRVYAVPTKYGS